MGVRTPQKFVVLAPDRTAGADIEAALGADMPGSQTIYCGVSLAEGLVRSREEGCDCAVVHMADGDPELISHVVSGFREFGVPVVCVVPESQREARLAAAAAGAAAIINDGGHPIHLSVAVMTVTDGGTWIPPDLAEAALRSVAPVSLSGQERRALVLYASGMTLESVARQMDITPNTVKHYLDRVRDKYTEVGIPSRTKVELHRIARLEGLLP